MDTSTPIERRMKSFRGSNNEVVRREDFVSLLRDIFDLGLYSKAREPRVTGLQRLSRPLRSATSYSDNQLFWQQTLDGRHREGMQVELHGFHITEWLPTSPGRYFTKDAIEARQAAERYWSANNEEYLPLGKLEMVLGGVGSVRLRSRNVDGQQCYFLGASSNGIVHQGVPLILPEPEFGEIVGAIAEDGGCIADIRGVLTVLPEKLSLIHFSRAIPKYCVFAHSLKLKRKSKKAELLGTIAVMYPVHSWRAKEFEKDGYKTSLTKQWTFCSFDPGEGQVALQNAAEWLADYAKRYDGTKEPIFSEFDEHLNYFDNPIEFPIRSVVNGRPDLDRLTVYGDYYEFTWQKKEVIVGDKFENIHNATIVSRSQVVGSFNKIASEYDEETADALLKVAGEVEKSQNKDAGALFDNFNQELQKSEPNKTVLKTVWDGIIRQLPSISSMVDVVSKITRLFTG